MDRRELLLAGGALASTFAARSALAQARAPAAAAVAPAVAPVMQKLQIDAYSRYLLWLKTAPEVAKAVIEMGFDGLDVAVRPGAMGHVDPERVATDLPAFVKVMHDNGIRVRSMATVITDADSPNAERILDAAATSGIHHYWGGVFRYDQTKPLQPQLDALKPRIDKLAKLNAKYGAKAMFHNYSGPGMVGSSIWDLLTVLRNFDPRWVSFHYDIGHGTNAGGNNTWAANMRAAGPYIGGLSVKDSKFILDLDTPEGGAFTGTPAQLNARPPGGFGGPGGPGGPPPGGPPPAPVSTAVEQAANERGVQGPPPAAPTPNGAPPTRANGGPPGGATPRGGGGQPNPWKIVQTPLGMGQVNLPLLADVLKEIQFQGPVEIQVEYPNGGADQGRDKITLPPAMVLGNVKRDLLTLKAAWAASGLI